MSALTWTALWLATAALSPVTDDDDDAAPAGLLPTVNLGVRRVPAEWFMPFNFRRPRRLAWDAVRGRYLDPRAPDTPLTPAQVRVRYRDENPRVKSYTVAGLELSLTLGAYGAWYIYDGFTAPSEWKWPATWDGFYRRNLRLEGVRFDANHPRYNSPGHPVAGAFYYGIGRHNGLNAPESLLLSILGSTWWEGMAEMREIISINDMVLTPLGGAPIAEAYHQLGQFCLEAGLTPVSAACLALFSAPAWLHSPVTRDRFPAVLDQDRWGFPRNRWHRFRVGVLAGVRSTPAEASAVAQVDAAAEAEVHTVRGLWVSPQTIHRIHLDTVSVLLRVRGVTGGGLPRVKLDLAELHARATWCGWVFQRPLAGNAVLVTLVAGLASGYEHWETGITEFWQYDRLNDFITVGRLLGPAVEAGLKVRGLAFRMAWDAYVDLAGVQSNAWRGWAERHGVGGTRSTLRKHSYQWHAGVSSSLRGVVEAGPVRWSARAGLDAFRAIRWRDQEYELVTGHDPTGSDGRTWWQTDFGLRLPGPASDLRLTGALELTTRHSRLGDVTWQRADGRLTGGVEADF